MSLLELKQAVVMEPGNAPARYALAEALFGEKAFRDARVQLEKTLTLDPNHANARRLLGRVFEALEQPSEAHKVLTHPNTYADLSDLHRRTTRPDDALLYADMSARNSPADPALWATCAQDLEHQGYFYRALWAYGRALQLSGGDSVHAEAIERI